MASYLRINSLQHPLVKHLVTLKKKGTYRKETNSCLLEGSKVISEICQFFPAKRLFVTEKHQSYFAKISSNEYFIVPQSIIDKISGLEQSDGIVAEMPLPLSQSIGNYPHLLILDRINDPGNLGTLLRTALGLGWFEIALIDKGCDPFNDKALRASRGAIYHLRWNIYSEIELISLIQEKSYTLLVADAKGSPFTQINPTKNIALVLSHESHGPSKILKEKAQLIGIPLNPKVESLNVAIAGGILMSYFI